MNKRERCVVCARYLDEPSLWCSALHSPQPEGAERQNGGPRQEDYKAARSAWDELPKARAQLREYAAERDEARARLGFANEEIARMSAEVRRLKAELQSARVGRAAADRDVLKYLDALAALEAELIDKCGWTQERCDEFTGLGEKDEPMTKQDIAEDVGHDRYRGLVEDE